MSLTSAPAAAHVHVYRDPTVRRIVPVLQWLEVSYLVHLDPPNFYSDASLSARGLRSSYRSDLTEIEIAAWKCMKSDSAMDLASTVGSLAEQLAASYPADQSLQIAQLLRTTSFDVSLDGIGTAVEKLVDSLDPLSRRRRQAELDHVNSTNSFEELALARSNSSAELRSLIENHQMLVDAEVISKDEMVQSIRAILAARTATTETLVELGVSPAIEP